MIKQKFSRGLRRSCLCDLGRVPQVYLSTSEQLHFFDEVVTIHAGVVLKYRICIFYIYFYGEKTILVSSLRKLPDGL